MRLVSIEGEYFRQYKKLGPIYFPEKGTIGLVGKTGAGKTTIMEAVELGLFGSIVGNDGKSKKKTSEIKYQEAPKGSKWWLILIFEKDGIQYKVCRHESTAKATLYADGVEVEVGQRDVTDHIVTKVLKMDQTAYLNAFYAKQGQIEGLNELKDEERKRAVSKLLKVDDIDKAIKLMRKEKNMLEATIDEQSIYVVSDTYFVEQLTTLKNNKKIYTANVKAAEKAFADYEKQYNDHNKEMEKLDAVFGKYQDISSNYREKQKEIQFLNEEVIPGLQTRIKQLKEDASKVPALEKEITGMNELTEKIGLMENQKLIYQRKKFLINQKETTKKSLLNQKSIVDEKKQLISTTNYESLIEAKTNELQHMSNMVNAESEKLTEMNNNLHLVTEDGRRKRNELNDIVTLGSDSTCPVCKRSLGEHHDHLVENFQQQINQLLVDYNQSKKMSDEQTNKVNTLKSKEMELNNELNKLQQESESNKLKIAVLETERTNFKRMKEDYTRIEEEMNTLKDVHFDEAEYGKMKNKLEQMMRAKNQLEVIQSKTQELPQLEKDLNTRITKQKDLEKELKTLEKQAKELQFDKQAYEDAKKRTNDIFETLRDSEKKLMENKQLLELNTREIKELNTKKKENEKINITLSKRKERFGVLLYLDEVYKKFKIETLAEIAPNMSAIMKDLLAYLTDGKYDTVKLDDHYNVFVHRNGKPQPLHMFSGGERTLVSLVQRLAISQLIVAQSGGQEFDFLCLDEVFGALDEALQLSVLKSLSKLKDVFPQILMISHNQNLNDLFDYTLIIEQNADGSSEAYWSDAWDEEEVIDKIA